MKLVAGIWLDVAACLNLGIVPTKVAQISFISNFVCCCLPVCELRILYIPRTRLLNRTKKRGSPCPRCHIRVQVHIRRPPHRCPFLYFHCEKMLVSYPTKWDQ